MNRHGFRQLIVGGRRWQYRIGKSKVVLFSPGGNKHCVRHSDLLGMSSQDIERMRWKNRGSDHPANVTPGDVARWIERNKEDEA